LFNIDKGMEIMPRNPLRLPSPTPEPQPEIRALPILDEVPSGYCLFHIDNARHEPHLHDGEWAVVDATDRTVVFGELYLILQSVGPVLHQVTRFGRPESIIGYDGRPVAMLSPLNQPRMMPNGRVDPSGPLFLSDGPIYVDDLLPDVLGRVVGIANPSERFDRQLREAMAAKRAPGWRDAP
jgi:hypothetical protein